MSGADLPDGGFANPAAAKLIVRRMRMRAGLTDAQRSIAALLQLLDQEAEACRDARAAVREGGIGLPKGDVEGGVSGIAVDDIEGKNVREKELLEGVKLVAQLLDRVEVGVRHGLFSSAGGREGIEPAVAAHRLCGGAK